MKNFDDLFNEFFKRKSSIAPIHNEIKKIIDSLTNYKKTELDVNEFGSEEAIANHLGVDLSDPTSTEVYIQDGMKFTKLTWDTPKGRFVKIVVTDVLDENDGLTSTPTDTPTEKSLEEQLQDAVDSEDFELAIKLRDDINSQKEKKFNKNLAD